MPRHEDPALRLIASLVALKSKEGAGYSRAAQNALQHADDLVALLGDRPAAAGYSEERIKRFKAAFFAAVEKLAKDAAPTSDEAARLRDDIIELWRRAWELTA